MPIKDIIVTEPTSYEAVDVIASASLKEPHRKYGSWMKELASAIRSLEIPKGLWQSCWTVAATVFGLYYRGHSEDVCRAVGQALATEMNTPPDKVDGILSAAMRTAAKYKAGRKARPQSPEGAI